MYMSSIQNYTFPSVKMSRVALSFNSFFDADAHKLSKHKHPLKMHLIMREKRTETDHFSPAYRKQMPFNIIDRMQGMKFRNNQYLPQENMSHCRVNVLIHRLTRRNHVTVLELHGFGTLSPQLPTDNYLYKHKIF